MNSIRIILIIALIGCMFVNIKTIKNGFKKGGIIGLFISILGIILNSIMLAGNLLK